MLRRLPAAALTFGLTACAYTETPARRECEGAADNLLRVEAAEHAGGDMLGVLAGALAPAAERVTGRRARAVARCETEWNRKVANCVRVASTAAELNECKPYPWSDPIEVAR